MLFTLETTRFYSVTLLCWLPVFLSLHLAATYPMFYFSLFTSFFTCLTYLLSQVLLFCVFLPVIFPDWFFPRFTFLSLCRVAFSSVLSLCLRCPSLFFLSSRYLAYLPIVIFPFLLSFVPSVGFPIFPCFHPFLHTALFFSFQFTCPFLLPNF